METVELLSETGSHHLVHESSTVELEPTMAIPTSHLLESRLVIPATRAAESGELKITGPRDLSFELWTPPLDEVTDTAAGRTQRHLENGQTQLLLAGFFARLSSREVHLAIPQVTGDGDRLGLIESDMPELLPFMMPREAGSRMHKLQSAANFAAALSLVAGGSREERRGVLDFRRYARKINKATGLPIPESLGLERVPFVRFEETASLHADSNEPSLVTTDIIYDEFDRTTASRVLTRYMLSQFNHWAPWDMNHEPLAMYSATHPDGQETGITFEIEVSQQELTPEYKDPVYARSEAEVRDMMGSFIRSRSNLIRYDRRAAGYLDRQVA